MACTILRLVQAAVSLRKRFECALQSSIDSVDGEEFESKRASKDEQVLDKGPVRESEVINASLGELQTLSSDVEIGFLLEHEPSLENPSSSVQIEEGSLHVLKDDWSQIANTEVSISVTEEENTIPNDSYDYDNKKDIHHLHRAKSSQESVSMESKLITKDRNIEKNDLKVFMKEKEERKENVIAFRSMFEPSLMDKKISKISNIITHIPVAKAPPSIIVCDSDLTDSNTSETDSDTFCSVKTVRLRSGSALSPSSGCKPAKLSRSCNVSSVEASSPGDHWLSALGVTGAATPILATNKSVPLRETNSKAGPSWNESKSDSTEDRKSSSSGSDSSSSKDINRRDWLGYSKWILKGRFSIEEKYEGNILSPKRELARDDTLEIEALDEIFDNASHYPLEVSDEDDHDMSKTPSEESEDFEDELEDQLDLEEEILILQESLDEGYIDDFKSFENSSIDVIYEEEEDDKGHCMTDNIRESLYQIGKPSTHFQQTAKNVENTDSRNSSVNLYHLASAGIPEDDRNWKRRDKGNLENKDWRSGSGNKSNADAEVVVEEQLSLRTQEDIEGGSSISSSDFKRIQGDQHSPSSIRWNSSRRSSKGSGSSKRNLRPLLVQRQRCVQLEERRVSADSCCSKDDCHFSDASSSRSKGHSYRVDGLNKGDAVLDVEPQLDVSSREIPVVVIASPKGGSYTQPLHKSYRSSSLYKVTSPGRGASQRHGGSLDASLEHPNIVSFIESKKSFESDRRLTSTRCEPYSPKMDSSMDSRGFPYIPQSDNYSRLSPREFRRSQSERIASSPTVETPIRSESVRMPRGHHPSFRGNRSPLYEHPDFFLRDFECQRGSKSLIAREPYMNLESPHDEAKIFQPTISSKDRYWRSEGMRRQSSLDSGELEDMLSEARQPKGVCMQCDSTTPSDDEDLALAERFTEVRPMEQTGQHLKGRNTKSKRYILQRQKNVKDLVDDPVVNNCYDETVTVQCRALWQLRSTFEDETPEGEPEFLKMEVNSFPDYVQTRQSPEIDNQTTGTSHTTSMESSSASTGTQTDHQAVVPQSSQGTVASSLIPSVTHPTSFLSSEERRTSYKAILSQRLRHLEARPKPAISSENSFDSAETDWSSTTDLSRAEAITTSLDSTTDSTGEMIPHRLHQMKADSGYKSLETSTTMGGRSLSQQRSSMIETSFEEQRKEDKSPSEWEKEGSIFRNRSWRCSERRSNPRMSAKKRRELLKEWKHVSLDAGLAIESELGTDETSGKRSVLARFLRTHRHRSYLRPGQLRLLQRDYSIDEKSDRLFKEFSQTDLPSDGDSQSHTRMSRLHPGRSHSRRLDSNDSSPHRRKLSPQDSIEEEEDDLWVDLNHFHKQDSRREDRYSLREERE